jgi:glucokinase
MVELAGSREAITAKTVSEAAAQGDSLALQLLRRAAFYIGLGLTNVIHMVEPQRILIGGGVSQAGHLLFEPIRETVNQRVMSDIYHGVEILPAALGDDAGLLGAVALVLSKVKQP